MLNEEKKYTIYINNLFISSKLLSAVVGWIGPPTRGSWCCHVGCCGWLDNAEKCRLGTWQMYLAGSSPPIVFDRHVNIHSVSFRHLFPSCLSRWKQMSE